MKVKSFSFAPILALLFCFVAGAFADNRPNIKINPAVIDPWEYPDSGVINSSDPHWYWYSSGECGDGAGHRHCGTWNFSGIRDWKNQTPVVRFGGPGTYVFGDYAVAGNTVLSFDWDGVTKEVDKNFIAGANGHYLKEDPDTSAGAFYLNSSKSTLKLPKGITKDDIVFAALYWQGNVREARELINEGWDK